MNKAIESIMAALNSAKAEIKTQVAAAKAAAPKGEKMPHGQHAQFVASSKVASAVLAATVEQGYVAASCRFTKTGDLCVTYRAPKTLADRLSAHAAATAKRKAAVDARKAAREAKKTAAVVTMPATGMAALNALNLKAA